MNNTINRKQQMDNPGRLIEQYIEGIILIIICSVAIVGNISIWIIVLRTKSLRTITNSFLLVLSAFDLLVSMVNMPISVVTVFAGDWLFSDVVCRGLGFFNMVTLCGSVLSLCNISINRYVMVCKPTKFSEIYTKKKTALMIIVSVLATVGVSLPPLFGWCEYAYTPAQYICFAAWPKSLSYALFMIGCCFGIPLVVMIVCNFKIYRRVKKSKTKIRGMQSYGAENTDLTSEKSSQTSVEGQLDSPLKLYKGQIINDLTNCDAKSVYSIQIEVQPKDKKEKRSRTRASQEEIRLATVLGIVVLVFFICWSPYCVSMIISIVAPNAVHDGFHMATLLIGYFNSCCNPIIYGILNKRFTKGFKNLYCFCRR